MNKLHICRHNQTRAGHTPLGITFAKDVEEERVHIIVQRLVVQEQLAEQAQALTVHLVLLPVHLPAHSNRDGSADHTHNPNRHRRVRGPRLLTKDMPNR